MPADNATRLSPALDRIPPQDLASEQAVLGCLMIDSTAATFDAVTALLSPADFYQRTHGRIFEAMIALSGRSEPLDILTVAGELSRAGLYDQAGGREYLLACIDAVPTFERAGYYAERVVGAADLRRAIDLGGRIVGWAYDAERPAEDILEEIEREALAIRQRRRRSGLVHIREVMDQVEARMSAAASRDDHMTGIATGFEAFDQMTGGLQNADLIVLAARPSMGKSALMLQWLTVAAERGLPVALFSLEMDREMVGLRLASVAAQVDSARIRNGQLSSRLRDDWLAVLGAFTRLSGLPFYLDDTPALKMAELRARAREAHRRFGLRMIAVDYLQLVDPGQRFESRNHAVDHVSRSLKSLARELQVPVVALSQLSRAVERRDDKRPILSDLRDSGSIESESDIVAFLYRPAYYRRGREQEDEDEGGGERAELIVAKHRNGPTGTVRMSFQPKFAYFKPALEFGEPSGSYGQAEEGAGDEEPQDDGQASLWEGGE